MEAVEGARVLPVPMDRLVQQEQLGRRVRPELEEVEMGRPVSLEQLVSLEQPVQQEGRQVQQDLPEIQALLETLDRPETRALLETLAQLDQLERQVPPELPDRRASQA
jgi:hypothetical protein